MTPGATAELTAAQRACARVLSDERTRARWASDPVAWSRDVLGPTRAAGWLAQLDPTDVAEAAGVLRRKSSASTPAAPTEAATAPRRSTPAGALDPGDDPPGTPTSNSGGEPDRAVGLARSTTPAVGVSFRPALMAALFDELAAIEVWEHILDWYLAEPDRGGRRLQRFVDVGPVTLHSLRLSVGSQACRERTAHLVAVRQVLGAVGITTLSDHLAFSAVDEIDLAHFVPLWRTEAQLDLLVRNVDFLQHELGVRMLLENPASPLDPGGDMTTTAMLDELCRRTGCGVLLDLENLHVNALNGQLDPACELAELDPLHVVGVHVAGGTAVDPESPAFDSHSTPVSDDVVDLLARHLGRWTNCEWVIVERDGRIEAAGEVRGDLRNVRRARAQAFPGTGSPPRS